MILFLIVRHPLGRLGRRKRYQHIQMFEGATLKADNPLVQVRSSNILHNFALNRGQSHGNTTHSCGRHCNKGHVLHTVLELTAANRRTAQAEGHQLLL